MSGQTARRALGQTMVIFAAALPVLVGFVGLALDGGYYLAAGEAVQFAASTAARAAAVAVQQGSYSTATAQGQAMGGRNLSALRLSGTTVAIAYHNDPNASPQAAGWYTTAPTTQTRAVRAIARATYQPLFLSIVGVTAAAVERTTVVSFGAGVLPLAVCTTVMNAQPSGPWLIWDRDGSLCGVQSWDGLVNLDGQARNCPDYRDWILPPPPSGPAPPDGSTVQLDTRRCGQVDNWLQQYPSDQREQTILVLDIAAGRKVVGCRRVTVDPSARDLVYATPLAPLEPCSALRETY
ncbi:MAG TPA: hypothetical protein VNM50_05860 [Chloroflexota bacterium]|nr:hypothetical protein [Chloroflexota bacterium]